MAGTSGTSVSQFLSTLIVTGVIAGIYLIIFLVLRKKQRRVYEPRSLVEEIPEGAKIEPAPKGPFGLFKYILTRSGTSIVEHTGSDGYFFIRFLFIFTVICIFGVIITWPILFSVNASNSKHLTGFDILAFGNVKNKWRYLAHIFISWVFFGTIIFVIYRELVHYVTYRHALQTTPFYDSLIQSRTLLLTEIPNKLLQEEELRAIFPNASNIWHARDCEELAEKVKERTKLAKKYEGAVNGVLTKAVKIRSKAHKKGKEAPSPEDDLNKYLKDGKKRPTHKLKFLIGKKVDTLDYGKERLGELNKEISKDQLEHNSYPQIPAVFIEFPTQLELQKAYQAIPYNSEFKGVKSFIGLAPQDIIWENLSLTTTKRRIKKVIASTLLTLMTIFWAIPVAVVGAISNLYSLTDKVHFLKFILNMPSVLRGIITGLLPVVALAILVSMVPPFIKKMGKLSGCLTVQQVNSYCQVWFYAFQVVNSFLVLTLTSAASSSVTSIISDPPSALPLLANKFPAASNFYISYLCFQGLSVPSAILLQLVPLILAQVLGRILDKTPRAKWTRWVALLTPGWATIYPAYQLMAVIAMSYSIIAPLILGFSFVAFTFIYIAFVYTLFFVMRPNKEDARGVNYPQALFQLLVGLYLAEAVITALFVFSKNWVSVALEALIIVVTVVAHIYLKRKFTPLIEAVPISAIKYASGDKTFQYPMYDQGYKEIKTEGENYWKGGNELGPIGSHDGQVLADVNEESKSEFKSESKSDDDSAGQGEKETLENDTIKEDNNKFGKSQVSWLTKFFKPRTESFDEVRQSFPRSYFNYVTYKPEVEKNAYLDPNVTDDEPHIWIAKDEMGLSEIEKNKALESGVDVTDENATFNEKGSIIYTGPPPHFEDSAVNQSLSDFVMVLAIY